MKETKLVHLGDIKVENQVWDGELQRVYFKTRIIGNHCRLKWSFKV